MGIGGDVDLGLEARFVEDSGQPSRIDYKAGPGEGSAIDGFFQILPKAGEDRLSPAAEALNHDVRVLAATQIEGDEDKQGLFELARGSYLNALKRTAERSVSVPGSLSAESVYKQIGIAEGRFKARYEELSRKDAAELSGEELSMQLKVNPPDNSTTQQQSFVVEILRTRTIVDIVMQQRSHSDTFTSIVSRILFRREAITNKININRVRLDYLRELRDIANEGLSPRRGGALYGALRLRTFKDSFIDREAEFVKNQHIRRLGLWSLLFCAGFLALDYLIGGLTTKMAIAVPEQRFLENFPLMASASTVGTWLSFAIRKVTLDFTDLAVIEDDRLNPVGRIIFVALLTCVIGLLLATGLFHISIGRIEVTASDSPMMAIVLGAICGISERSLAGVVSGRSREVLDSMQPSQRTEGNL